METENFKHVKPGDRLIRVLGEIEIRMKVIRVDDTLIYATLPSLAEDPDPLWVVDIVHGWQVTDLVWTFDRETGAEADDILQWGLKWGVTGSFIKRPY